MSKRKSPQSLDLAAEQRSSLPPTLLRLEDRIVLDAAGGGDGDHHQPLVHLPLPVPGDQPGEPAAHHPGGESANPAPPEHAAHEHHQPDPDAISAALEAAFRHEPTRVLIIGPDIEQADALAAAARGDVLVVQLDSPPDSLAAVLEQVQVALGNRQADSIAIATHGRLGGGGVTLPSGQALTLDTLHTGELRAFWAGIANLLKTGGRVDLLACDAAAGAEGALLIQHLEQTTGLDFAASDDPTGNSAAGGDWLLESDHVRVDTLYFRPSALHNFSETLAPPSITDSNPGTAAVGTNGPVIVDPSIAVNDGGAGSIEGAVVRISRDTYQPDQDALAFTPAHGITGTFDSDTGELILSGVAADWQYQEVLRTVTYENTASFPDTTPREIFFSVGVNFDTFRYNSITGHYYTLRNAFETWDDAQTLAHAEGNALHGLRGYLATVTSAAEQVEIGGLLGGLPAFQFVWFGAGDDVTVEGDWFWLTGPEGAGADAQFWQGGAGGGAVDGAYTNWFGGAPPDDAATNRIAFFTNLNQWRSVGAGGSFRYVIEYGGDPDDAEGQINASVLVDVAEPNFAPVLDAGGVMSLLAIDEDNLDNAGTTVAAIISSAGGDRITDANGDPEGIALIGLNTTYGTWQYSTDGGANWYTVGSVSANNALLLRDTDLLRFQPDANYNGSINSAIGFRAWDRSAGTAGTYADASTGGGASPFSSATESASLTVNSVNDAPTLAEALLDQSANEDQPFTYTFDADAFSDVDAGDTLTYNATLADGSPLPDWLTFDPDTRTFTGTPAEDDVGALDIRVTATDSTGASANDTFNLVVSEVNDIPTVAQPLVDHVISDGDDFTYQFAEDAFVDDDPADNLNYAATLEDGSDLPTWLAFDPLTRTFAGTPTAADGGTLRIKVTASDGRGGSVSDVFLLTVDAPTTPAAPPVDPGGTDDPVYIGPNSGGGTTPAADPNPGEAPAADDSTTTPTTPQAPGAESGEATDTTDLGESAGDADLTDTPAAEPTADTGGEATAPDAQPGAAAAPATGGANAGGPGGNAAGIHDPDEDPLAYHDHEDADEYLNDFNNQLTGTLLSGDFLDDESQPVEFRAAWSTILGAYSDSTEELAAYLQSAFRVVTESALIHQAAEQALDDLLEELALAAEFGANIDLDELIAELQAARDAVREASGELEQAIHAAADAGRQERFDRVLEDVIRAALEQLMVANEQLYVESQATLAAVALLREGRDVGPQVLGPETFASATTLARSSAHDEIVEMRKSWDRVAQDVFAAFVARLVAERGDAEAPITPPLTP